MTKVSKKNLFIWNNFKVQPLEENQKLMSRNEIKTLVIEEQMTRIVKMGGIFLESWTRTKEDLTS